MSARKRIDRYEVHVDGKVVVATRTPGDVEIPRWPRLHGFKSLFEVHVDGEHRGRLGLPSGFGTEWEAWAFGSVVRSSWDNDHPRVLNPHGRPGHREGPESLLDRYPGWVAEGKAPTLGEIGRFVAENEAEKARRDAEDARRFEAARIEDAARKKLEDEARVDRLASLEGLRDRLSGQMTNSEAAALVETIEALRGDIDARRRQDEYFESVRREKAAYRGEGEDSSPSETLGPR